MRILITDGMDAAAQSELLTRSHTLTLAHIPQEALGAALREFDAVIIRSATQLRRAELEAAQGGALKLIVRAGVGLDNVDVAYAREMGLTVRNTPNASANAVAELAMGLMLACARHISIAGHTMRQDRWEKRIYTGTELSGKTLGILGFGRIGRRIAAIAAGFGMEVLVYEPKAPVLNRAVLSLPLEAVLRQADVLSVNTPALSLPILDREAFSQMKDGVILVNTSRGCNVDEAALLEALDAGKVRAAGLDVWAEEPSRNPDLYRHPRVACTPHVGASTREAQARIGQEIVEIIGSFPFQPGCA